MADRPYSERFILYAGATSTGQTYVVPSGYRAVLRSLLTRATTAADGVNLYVNGTLVYIWRAPGANAAANTDMRQVVYSGGSVLVQMSGATASAMCSGYLFSDNTGKRDSALGFEPDGPAIDRPSVEPT